MREAVSEYLHHRAVTVWPTDLAQWMRPTEIIETGDWPDMDAIRAEANANMAQRAAQI